MSDEPRTAPTRRPIPTQPECQLYADNCPVHIKLDDISETLAENGKIIKDTNDQVTTMSISLYGTTERPEIGVVHIQATVLRSVFGPPDHPEQGLVMIMKNTVDAVKNIADENKAAAKARVSLKTWFWRSVIVALLYGLVQWVPMLLGKVHLG